MRDNAAIDQLRGPFIDQTEQWTNLHSESKFQTVRKKAGDLNSFELPKSNDNLHLKNQTLDYFFTTQLFDCQKSGLYAGQRALTRL